MLVIPAPNDVAFYIGNFPVYFYGITMATAIFAGILIANYLFNKINTPDKKDIILEYAPLFILFGILGARLYYCCLNPTYYFAHPIEILDIRKGGLSIHGSIIGGILNLLTRLLAVSYLVKQLEDGEITLILKHTDFLSPHKTGDCLYHNQKDQPNLLITICFTQPFCMKVCLIYLYFLFYYLYFLNSAKKIQGLLAVYI